jgi:hypothetical protein
MRRRRKSRASGSRSRCQGKAQSLSKAPRILGFSGHSSYGTDTLFDDIVRTLGAST